MEKIGICLLNPQNVSTRDFNYHCYLQITHCREHYFRLGSNGRVQICKSIRPTSMCQSIFSTTCLPRPNSISTTHFATKLGRQGCGRKNDRVDYNDFNHNNTFGNSLHDIQKMSICILLTKGMLPLVSIQHDTPRHRLVVNLASAEAMWAHFASITVHPSQLRITGYPRAYDMHIIKLCCCRQLQIDWQNIVLCDLDRNVIKLPALGKISLWSTNDLASIENNIPYQIWVYGRVLDLVIPLEIKDDVHITDHRLY